MLAYFHKGQFFGMWQDQASMPGWLDLTIQANGHSKADVEVYHCPAIRNDESFYFDEDKRLIVGQKRTEEVDGVPRVVTDWESPVELERFYPAP